MVTNQKIELFKHLFKGRQDVIPRYWKTKNGKSGYSPIRKGDKYVRLTNHHVLQHLKGQGILGVYPLLENNTCFFMPADLDNHTGRLDPLKDSKEYYEVCKTNEIPCYLLRSKSGLGYHAYIFFKNAVPAWKARVTAKLLLEETQIVGEDSSFDRLFPSQDKLSGKGFGNLISLPFQGKASKKGHTVFLDPKSGFTVPYDKQKQYNVMANIKKIDESILDNLIDGFNLKKPLTTPCSEQIEDFLGPDFNIVLRECSFIVHCKYDAKTLPYTEWWAMISNVIRCVDGEKLVHEFSEPYPRYDPIETNRQIENALKFPRPVSCWYIQKETGSKYCKTCKHYKKVTGSPAGFGYN